MNKEEISDINNIGLENLETKNSQRKIIDIN